MFHESPAATTDMDVLPGVLGCRTLQRTLQVRLGLEFGFGISDLGFLTTIDDVELNTSDFAICSLVLKSFSASFQSAFRNRRSGGKPIFAVSPQQFMKHPG
jgi:glycopeptide antibiotics resistance protein